MKLDAIIIGAGRSGTTSLVDYVGQHPSINFSTIKEVTYFSVTDHYKRGEDFLFSFFNEDSNMLKATSDTYLLMDEEAPQRLFNHNPEAKIIVILRSPSERSFSSYQYAINNGHQPESISFLQSQKLEKELSNSDIITRNNRCHFYGSLYHKHISNWLTYFNKSQLFICKTEDLKNDPKKVMKSLFSFLQLPEAEVSIIPQKNKAASVKSKGLNQFLVNRDHWLRTLIRKPMQVQFLRKFILNSNLVDVIKQKNRQTADYREMTVEENAFCQSYFEHDLQMLKKDFEIEFKG